jgi:hypothetical protein
MAPGQLRPAAAPQRPTPNIEHPTSKATLLARNAAGVEVSVCEGAESIRKSAKRVRKWAGSLCGSAEAQRRCAKNARKSAKCLRKSARRLRKSSEGVRKSPGSVRNHSKNVRKGAKNALDCATIQFTGAGCIAFLREYLGSSCGATSIRTKAL